LIQNGAMKIIGNFYIAYNIWNKSAKGGVEEARLLRKRAILSRPSLFGIFTAGNQQGKNSSGNNG